MFKIIGQIIFAISLVIVGFVLGLYFCTRNSPDLDRLAREYQTAYNTGRTLLESIKSGIERSTKGVERSINLSGQIDGELRAAREEIQRLQDSLRIGNK